MPKYRKKPLVIPVVIEAITFDELVEHGLNSPGAQIDFRKADPNSPVWNAMPWSFEYKGYSITHENDDRYLIPTLGGLMSFNRGDMLRTTAAGGLYPCKADIFEQTYEKVEE